MLFGHQTILILMMETMIRYHMFHSLSCITWTELFTHPHKKDPVMKNHTRHLTSFSMVIYQAEHNLWCPVNVGWENFAQLQKFKVK